MAALRVLDVPGDMAYSSSAAPLTLAAENRQFRSNKEKKVAEFRSEDSDSRQLLQQSVLLLDLERAKAAERALNTGTYLVTKPSAAVPLTLPRAEVLTMGGKRGAEQVNITFILSLAQFPNSPRPLDTTKR